MKKVDLEGHGLLLARIGGQYYCVDSKCPHLSGDLSKGTLEGTILTCPVHHSKFDLANGHVAQWTDWSGLTASVSKIFKAPRPLRTYPVKVDDGKVLAGID